MVASVPVRILPASKAHIPGVQSIYAHHVRTGCATFELDPPTVDEMMDRYTHLVGDGFPFLVAEVDAQVIGYAYAGPYRSRPAYRLTVENSIYVSPSWLQRGIGQALLPELIKRCEDSGYRQMIAVIGDSANGASVRLHAKYGFRLVGILEAVGFKFGRWLDCVLMQRPLSDGAKSLP